MEAAKGIATALVPGEGAINILPLVQACIRLRTAWRTEKGITAAVLFACEEVATQVEASFSFEEEHTNGRDELARAGSVQRNGGGPSDRGPGADR